MSRAGEAACDAGRRVRVMAIADRCEDDALERRLLHDGAHGAQRVHDVAGPSTVGRIVRPHVALELRAQVRVAIESSQRGDRVLPALRFPAHSLHSRHDSSSPEAIERAADLGALVPVRDLRLLVRQLHELRVGALVPERERHDPHQRSISVGVLAAPAGAERGRTSLERAQRFAGLNPAVEDATVDRHVPLLAPGKEPTGEVVRVEAIALEQRGEEAQRVRAIVRPGTGRRPLVRPLEPDGWGHRDRVRWRQGAGLVKLVGDTECVADEQSPDGAAHAIGDQVHGRTFSSPCPGRR